MVIKERNKMTISISFTPVWIEVRLQVEVENHNENLRNGCINIEFPRDKVRCGLLSLNGIYFPPQQELKNLLTLL